MKKIILAIAMVATSVALNAQNVASVNTQKLLDTMPSKKMSDNTLKDMEALYMKEIQEMQTALQAEYQKYLSIKDLPTTSSTVRSYSEERLQKKQQELEQRQEELGQLIQNQQVELNKPITERVQKAIKIVSERKKIDYVLEEMQTLYSNPIKDITKEVMTELLKLEAEAMKVVAPKQP
jgi:outer membrane protein